MERVLERIAERVTRTFAWEGIRRADLIGRPGAPGRQRPSLVEDDFSDAWGRMELRDDPDADEHAEYPGFGGGV
ncbi:MAG TPA: hypothetical protein VF406_05175 [Thermodesulfobacteriota bacterium]